MTRLQTFLLSSMLSLVATSASAQTCGDLCDYNWWKSVSQDEIREAISKADVHARNQLGETALMWVARDGTTENLKVLLDAGADVHARDEYGTTALMNASQARTTENLKVLLDAGADVNARTGKDGWTVLMFAAANGTTENLKVLLDAGADVHARDEYGTTALMNAAEFGAPENLKVLLDAGADVNARRQNGETALQKLESSQLYEAIGKTDDYWRKRDLLWTD